jgi:hypothetical protein
MAKPIEPTPTLTGKSAERFYQSLDESKYSAKKERMLNEAVEVFKVMSEHLHTAPSVLKSRE